MSLNIGDIVRYGSKQSKVYGIVVGFRSSGFYYIDWFDYGRPSGAPLVPYHISSLIPIGLVERP